MKATKPILNKSLCITLCFAILLSIMPGFTLTASAAGGVVPYNFAIGTNGIFEGIVHNVGDASEKVGSYFLLDSNAAKNGFSTTFEMTTNNIFRSQFCVTSYAGVIGQNNRNAVEVDGGSESWTITYPKYVFDHHTEQTITLKTSGEVRGLRTIWIPIRDFDGSDLQNIYFLGIKVLFYDSSTSTADITRNINWLGSSGYADGATMEYPSDSPESATLQANWKFADNKYMSATYQWYKEINGSYSKISGATSQTYKPDGPGKYKVDIAITVENNKLAGVPAGKYVVSTSVNVAKRDIVAYVGIDKKSSNTITKTSGDTYRFSALLYVPGTLTIKKGNLQYNIISTANGSSTYFFSDYITAAFDQAGTYSWIFVPSKPDYHTSPSGSLTLVVNPADPQVSVSITSHVATCAPETGNVTLKAAAPGTFRLTTQGATKNYTYSAAEAGSNKVVSVFDLFTTAAVGEAALEYTFIPDSSNYKTVSGSVNYTYVTAGIVNITQNAGGTVTVGGKSDSTLVLEDGKYTIKVVPASNGNESNIVTGILVNGTALPADKLTKNADGSVTAELTVAAGTAYTVSATYDRVKLAVKNNATVYIDNGSLAEINKAIFDAVVDQSNSAGITASDISTLYYMGYCTPPFSSGYEDWRTPNTIPLYEIFTSNAHAFGNNSAESYKEKLKISVPGTPISVTVNVTAYRRSPSNITVNTNKIAVSESEYSYDGIIRAIGAKLNNAESTQLQYLLDDGKSFSSAWNTKSAGDQFTVTVKYNGTKNGANSAGAAQKAVSVYIRPEIAVSPEKVERKYTGSPIQLAADDFTASAKTGTCLPVTVSSVAYYDSSKTALSEAPSAVGNYYVKLGLSDSYGSFESDYIPMSILQPSKYTVIFNSNGGEGTMADQEFTYGVEQALTANAFAKEGHTFTGWKDADGKTYTDKQSVKNLTAENGGKITLTAQWDTNSYSIVYHANNHSNPEQTETQYVNYDATVNLYGDIFDYAGLVLGGWTDDSGTEYALGQEVSNLTTEDGAVINLYAKWEDDPQYGSDRTITIKTVDENGKPVDNVPVQLMLNNNQNGLDGHSKLGDVVTTDENGVAVITDGALDAVKMAQTIYCNVSGAGYAWAFDPTTTKVRDANAIYNTKEKTDVGGLNEYIDVLVAEDFGFEAEFTLYVKRTTYTVEFDANTGDGTMDAQSIQCGVETALNANEFTKAGYSFVEWNTAADGSGTAYADKAAVTDIAEPGKTITLYAQWVINKYTVTFDEDGGSEVEDAENVPYGSAITVPETTREGYDFLGWFNGEEQLTENTVITGDVTYTAQWQIKTFTITWIVDGSETTETYDYGTMPSFKGSTDKAPTVEFSYVFKGWTPEIVKVTGEATYTAEYDSIPNLAQLTVKYTGAFSMTPPEYTETVQCGTEYRVETPVLDGYEPDIAVVEGTMPSGDLTVTVTYTCTHPTDAFGICGEDDCKHPDDCTCNPDTTDGVRTFDIVTKDSSWNRIPNVPVALIMNPNTGWDAAHTEIFYGVTDENGSLAVPAEVLENVLPGSSLYLVVVPLRNEDGSETVTHDWAWTDLSYGKLRVVSGGDKLVNAGIVTDEGSNEYAFITAREGVGFTAEMTIFVQEIGDLAPVVGKVNYIVQDVNGNPFEEGINIIMSLNKRVNGKTTHIGTTSILNGSTGSIEIDAAELASLPVGTILDCDPSVGHYEWALGDVEVVRTMEIVSGSIDKGTNKNHDAVITAESLENGFEITFTCVLRKIGGENDTTPSNPTVPAESTGVITFNVTDAAGNAVSGLSMNLNARYNGSASVIGTCAIENGVGTITLDQAALSALNSGASIDCDPVGDYVWALDECGIVRTISDMTGAITLGSNANHNAVITGKSAAEGFSFTFNCKVKSTAADAEPVAPSASITFKVADVNGNPIENGTMALNSRYNGQASVIGRATIENGIGTLILNDLSVLKEGMILDCDPEGNHAWAIGEVSIVRTVEAGYTGIALGTNVNQDAKVTAQSLNEGFDITFVCIVTEK